MPDTPTRQEVDRIARGERRRFYIGLGLILLGAIPIAIVGWQLWPLSVCVIVPMVGATTVTFIFQKVSGNDLHPVMIPLGIIWIGLGLLLVVMML